MYVFPEDIAYPRLYDVQQTRDTCETIGQNRVLGNNYLHGISNIDAGAESEHPRWRHVLIIRDIWGSLLMRW